MARTKQLCFQRLRRHWHMHTHTLTQSNHLHHIHKINLIYCCLVFLSTIAGHIGRLRQTSPLLQQISQATDGTLQLATWDLHPAQVANLIYMSSAAPVSETRRTIFENYFAHNQGMCSSENICDHLRSSCLGSSGIIWDHLGSPGTTWDHLGSKRLSVLKVGVTKSSK